MDIKLRRMASTRSLAEGEILMTRLEGDGEMIALAPSPSRGSGEPVHGCSSLDNAVGGVCAEHGYTEEEREFVVSVLGPSPRTSRAATSRHSCASGSR